MTLDADDVNVVRQWLRDRSAWTKPETVACYEREFERWNGSRHAFAFMGGRVALSACIYALGLRPGDEVILPGYTCVVVRNAFRFAGVATTYSDIELETYGLDVSALASKIAPRTRAILLQHLYGLVCRDYDEILDLAKRHGLAVIEDCAHATGARHQGVRVGNRGDLAVYSSEQSKIFNTIQGGIAVTNDDALAQKLAEYYEQAPEPDPDLIERQLYNVILNYYGRKHRQRWWSADLVDILYGERSIVTTTTQEEQGIPPPHYGRRMPGAIAALGVNQLKKIDMYNAQRRHTALHWDGWCESRGYGRPKVIAGSEPVFLRYPVLVEPEKKINRRWAEEQLGVRIGVWFVGHLHPIQEVVDGCPNAAHAIERCINLPSLLY
jgi:dTDP-4-amino-4,6-dideoxygalactose transaminase